MDCKLWIAFKVNAIHDLTSASRSFDNAFQGMKKHLLKNGVHLASLGANMRNVKSIGACSKNLRTFSSIRSEYKMTKQIKALDTKSDVDCSIKPLYIPIQNLGQDLPDAMTLALERTKKETKCLVVMHDPRFLSSKRIQKVLVQCGEEKKNILFHPQRCRNESVRGLQKFLRCPNGIYVVPQKNFDGMESKSVIYISNDNDDSNAYNSESVRSHLSRAVMMLTLIHQLRPNSYFKPNSYIFHSMEVEPKFIECCKELKYEAFKCNDQNLHLHSKPSNPTTPTQIQHGSYLSNSSNENGKGKLICYPCIAYCHRGHEQRSHVKLGGSSSSSVPGILGMAFIDGARRIMRSIIGETKCHCSDITQCQLSVPV